MSGDNATGRHVAAINPQALSPDDFVRTVIAAGARSITVEKIRADIDAGAPQNADGTINLVHYAAWLVKETAHGD